MGVENRRVPAETGGGLGLGERGGRVGYGTSGRLSQFPDFNIDGCRESARVIQCVNFRPVF